VAVIPPVPMSSGGRNPKLELDRRSTLRERFKDRWGTVPRRHAERVRRLFTEEHPKVATAGAGQDARSCWRGTWQPVSLPAPGKSRTIKRSRFGRSPLAAGETQAWATPATDEVEIVAQKDGKMAQDHYREWWPSGVEKIGSQASGRLALRFVA
jgi:hypothetical protein